MKNDLISRVALLDDMPKKDELFSYDVRRAICDAPAVDAVEVVRCRECKHRGKRACPMKMLGSGAYIGHSMYDEGSDKTTNNGFCHKGER